MSTITATEPALGQLSRRAKILTLVTACFALFLAMLDNTVVNVALPQIQSDLSASVTGLQWVVSGYTLTFASLMLSGGTLADRYGRKRLFIAGLAVFTLASLAAGLAPDIGWLIAARAMQGVGAAMLQPGSLAILTHAFPNPAERAKAIGIWAGISGLALGMGPVVGGLLVDSVGWQSVFFLNLPIGVAGLFCAQRFIVESRNPAGRRIDMPGQILAVITLSTATYALIEGNERGWTSPLILGLFAVAGAALIGFLRVEATSAHPMLELSFFRNPTFAGANLIGFAVGLGMFAIFFFLSLNMQQTYGYSPLQAGIRILPVTLCVIVAAPIAGRLAAKHGPHVPLIAGLLLAAAAQLALLTLEADSSYASYVWALPLSGLGLGMTMTPMTAAVMNAVPASRAGMASATTNTSREVGGNFGIALIGALLVDRFTSTLRDKLSDAGLPAAARDAIVDSAAHGHGTTDPTAVDSAAITRMVDESFVSGVHLALVVAAGFLLLAAVVAVMTIRPRRYATTAVEQSTEAAPATA